MSYTIYLKDKDGNEVNEWEDSICPTFNRATRFYHAMGVNMGELNGWLAAKAIRFLRLGISRLELDPGYYKRFNAPNGWGVYEDAVWTLKMMLSMCNNTPNAFLNIY